MGDESEVRAREDERARAMLDGDRAAFAALAHPDLLYTHSSGSTDSVTSYLAKLESGQLAYHSIEHPIERLVIAGDTALVLGRLNADLMLDGTPRHLDYLCLAVWVRTGSTWQFIAFQPTPTLAPR